MQELAVQFRNGFRIRVFVRVQIGESSGLLKRGDRVVGRLHFGANVVELTREPLRGLKDGVMACLVLSLDKMGEQCVYDSSSQPWIVACEADIDDVTRSIS